MRFTIQRVFEASVSVAEKEISKIGKGILVLAGFTHTDKYEDIDFAANKLLNIRLFDDEKGTRWKCGVKEKNYEILIVSQFTLFSFLKGNKPDFHKAMDGEVATKFFDKFVEVLQKKYDSDKVQTGAFGQYMKVSLVNDGPVTINWEYPEESSNKIEDLITNDTKKKEKKTNTKNNNKKVKTYNQEKKVINEEKEEDKQNDQNQENIHKINLSDDNKINLQLDNTNNI
jgi:D-tyrosyl-tRNA(Tyr) deacylase